MKWISTIFCFLSLLAFQTVADDVEQQTEPETSGEAIILEFDHSEQDYEKEEKESRGPEQTGGIEMIVGGQGEDGIAKRKQLQVID